MAFKRTDPLVALDSLANIKQAILDHKAEGQKIISHFKHMEEYYSAWEDRLLAINVAMLLLEIETGQKPEELLKEPEVDVFEQFKV